MKAVCAQARLPLLVVAHFPGGTPDRSAVCAYLVGVFRAGGQQPEQWADDGFVDEQRLARLRDEQVVVLELREAQLVAVV